jgi:S1-C subfamily serine protease
VALPTLPISGEDLQSIVGEPVVLLGYPTGVDGLLQRIDENERRGILSEHGRSAEDVAMGLAEKGLIRPLTTTGVISDALPARVVHSAHTTEGGSGGPLFDREGRVIAVNQAVLTAVDGSQNFGGSNFGVPIKAVSEFLVAYHQSSK